MRLSGCLIYKTRSLKLAPKSPNPPIGWLSLCHGSFNALAERTVTLFAQSLMLLFSKPPSLRNPFLFELLRCRGLRVAQHTSASSCLEGGGPKKILSHITCEWLELVCVCGSKTFILKCRTCFLTLPAPEARLSLSPVFSSCSSLVLCLGVSERF